MQLCDQHLPPQEELIGPGGTVHRMYPAPSPIAAPVNSNSGWAEDANEPTLDADTNRQDHQGSKSSLSLTLEDRRKETPKASHASDKKVERAADSWGEAPHNDLPTPPLDHWVDPLAIVTSGAPFDDRNAPPHLALFGNQELPSRGAYVEWFGVT